MLVSGLRELGFDVPLPKATFYVWVPVKDCMSFAAKLLNEAGIVVTPGIGFGSAGEGYVRFAITRPVERIQRGHRAHAEAILVKLPPHLTIRNGHLHVGGHDCVSLSEKYGTPLYVTSEDRICDHFRAYQQALSSRYPNVQVLFAAKANGNLAVMRALAQLGCRGRCLLRRRTRACP